MVEGYPVCCHLWLVKFSMGGDDVALKGFIWEVFFFNKWLTFKKTQSAWKSIVPGVYYCTLFFPIHRLLFFYSFSITLDARDACQLIAFYKLFCRLNTNNMTACRLLVVMVFLLCSGQCHIKNITSRLLFASTKYFNINTIISEWQDVYDIISTKKAE